MKSAVVAFGLFASMANAYSHPRHFHFRRDNTTIPADDSLTTLTVIATQTSTIISCAPTVTNCPAHSTDIDQLPESDKTTAVVTNTVILTETVCPVSEAPAISSSIIDQASTLTPIATITAPTAGATQSDELPVETSIGSTITTHVSEIVESHTLTFTQGTGTDASVVTSTYGSTIYTTVVVTVPCNGGCGGAAPSEEPTTTTTATSTATTTVTVPPPSQTGPGESDSNDTTPGNGSNNGGGQPGNENDEEGVCEDHTVTVTIPASTVYVTVGASDVPTATAPAVVNPAVPSSGANNEDDDEDAEDIEDEDDEEDECPAEVTATATSTVTVPPPYPTGNNGTHPGNAAPSGFVRLRI
jgi:hypothetical protein